MWMPSMVIGIRKPSTHYVDQSMAAASPEQMDVAYAWARSQRPEAPERRHGQGEEES
jgi:hypothetical protein